jgi:hypothetical protein
VQEPILREIFKEYADYEKRKRILLYHKVISYKDKNTFFNDTKGLKDIINTNKFTYF